MSFSTTERRRDSHWRFRSYDPSSAGDVLDGGMPRGRPRLPRQPFPEVLMSSITNYKFAMANSQFGAVGPCRCAAPYSGDGELPLFPNSGPRRSTALPACIAFALLFVLSAVGSLAATDTNAPPPLTPEQMFEGGTIAYTNWVDFTAGGALVHGSRAQFQQQQQLRRAHSAASAISISSPVSPRTRP